MITALKRPGYTFALRILKLLVLVLSVRLIYKELFIKDKFQNFADLTQSGSEWFSPFWFAAGCILVFLNWGIETRKWQVLIRPYEQIRFFKAYGAVLTGVFVSFFTPNRVGEFAGRLIYLDNEKKWESAISSVVGSFSQLLCTLIFGLLSLFFYLTRENTLLDPFYQWGFVFLWLIIVSLIVFTFLNIDRIYLLLRWLKLPRKWLRHFVILRKMEKSLLLRVLWLSTLRYMVFTLQYLLFMKAFLFTIPLGAAINGIGTLFLLQSIVPTFALSELTFRGASAQHVFAGYEDRPAEIMMAAYSIWLINIFIPALAGAVFFLFKRANDADS